MVRVDKIDIRQIISTAITEINRDLPEAKKIPDQNFVIYGEGVEVDSLILVNLLTEIETLIYDLRQLDIDLFEHLEEMQDRSNIYMEDLEKIISESI